MNASSLVDTHAHLDMNAFDEDRTETITRALDVGVGNIISVGIDLKSSKKAIEISERYAGVYAAVGIHPHDVTAIDKADITRLGEIAKHSGVVAIGETGLDFYRDYSPKKAQIQALKWQLALSAKLELPVIIHCRQAEEDMLDLLRSWISEYGDTRRQCRGVIHCFSGDINTAKEYLNMDFYLSLGAYIGYPSSLNSHDVIRSIPKERLLVETDCPFLPPQSYRGKRNEPSYLPFTVKTLASIREESYDEVARVTTQNAQRLFRLPPNNN
ncbi:TatD family hydrolase [Chloroflexota bacterium]